MTSDPTFVLPADFVAARVCLRPAELAHGFRAGYLDERGVVQLAELVIASAAPTLPAIEELALLLSREYGRVPELVTEIETSLSRPSSEESFSPGTPWDSDPSRVWLYLVLDWLYSRRAHLSDPLGEIETVYADFDYPDEIDGLVRYLPAPPGQPSGASALEDRWRDFLDRRAIEYADRPCG